jgi:uncharacterized protein DUF5678
MERPTVQDPPADELERNKGRWVAVDQGHVVASGASAKEASEGARKRGVTDPILFYVPVHPERVNFF